MMKILNNWGVVMIFLELSHSSERAFCNHRYCNVIFVGYYLSILFLHLNFLNLWNSNYRFFTQSVFDWTQIILLDVSTINYNLVFCIFYSGIVVELFIRFREWLWEFQLEVHNPLDKFHISLAMSSHCLLVANDLSFLYSLWDILVCGNW